MQNNHAPIVCMQPRCHASRKPVAKIVLCAHECIPTPFPVTRICDLKYGWAAGDFPFMVILIGNRCLNLVCPAEHHNNFYSLYS